MDFTLVLPTHWAVGNMTLLTSFPRREREESVAEKPSTCTGAVLLINRGHPTAPQYTDSRIIL